MVREISVEELKARRDRGEKPLVLDVREDWELQLARIPDVVHVPMNQVPARLGGVLPRRGDHRHVPCGRTVHAGGAISCRTKGLRNVANLTGGIAAWSESVDATVPQY